MFICTFDIPKDALSTRLTFAFDRRDERRKEMKKTESRSRDSAVSNVSAISDFYRQICQVFRSSRVTSDFQWYSKVIQNFRHRDEKWTKVHH